MARRKTVDVIVFFYDRNRSCHILQYAQGPGLPFKYYPFTQVGKNSTYNQGCYDSYKEVPFVGKRIQEKRHPQKPFAQKGGIVKKVVSLIGVIPVDHQEGIVLPIDDDKHCQCKYQGKT